MTLRTSDCFAVMVVVSIFSWIYSNPKTEVWVTLGASGPDSGQYSEYGVFSSALVIGKEEPI
ncbi:MAG: hypothetical protein ACK5PB_17870 [Pirellula sp.]